MDENDLDGMTGLPNEQAFTAQLESAILGSKSCSIAIGNLDRLQDLLDHYGYFYADQLILHAAPLKSRLAG